MGSHCRDRGDWFSVPIAQNYLHRILERIHSSRRVRLVRRLLPVTNQNRMTAGRSSGCDIPMLIADDPTMLEIQVHVAAGLQNHPRIGLAPRMIAAIFLDRAFGVVWTVIKPLDQPGLMHFIVKELGDALVHSIDISLGKLAARHAALVGDDDQPIARLMELNQRLSRAFL